MQPALSPPKRKFKKNLGRDPLVHSPDNLQTKLEGLSQSLASLPVSAPRQLVTLRADPPTRRTALPPQAWISAPAQRHGWRALSVTQMNKFLFKIQSEKQSMYLCILHFRHSVQFNLKSITDNTGASKQANRHARMGQLFTALLGPH